MNPLSSRSNKPRAPRRRARTWASAGTDPRAVQIGLVATVAVHLLLLASAPKIGNWLDDGRSASADTWSGAREFQIELAPAEPEAPEPLRMPEFVEANPEVPDNAPDKTDLVATQNQQVAQETPTPDGRSDAPATEGDPDVQSTAIVSGTLREPAAAVRRPPPAEEPQTQETPEEEAARRSQTPLPGSEKFEGDNPDGAGGNVGKPAPDAAAVPERVEGVAESANATGGRVGLYYQVDPKRPQPRRVLAPDVVRARATPLAHREFGTENIGAVAYNAKWSAYGEYLQKFIETVDVQWQRIIGQSNIYPVVGTKVVVVFRMDSQGDVSEIIRVESEGGRAAKDACVSAIVARAPYGAWPEDMVAVLGDSQEITFTFHYN